MGNDSSLKNTEDTPPFNIKIINLLDDLSNEILRNPESKTYSDLISFAFWCRKRNLKLLQNNYHSSILSKKSIGTILHITPSNIPLMFAYSMVVGLLAGNKNIIRISNKEFPQVKILIKQLNNLIVKRHILLQDKIAIVQYNHNHNITKYLSEQCNARLIWGGNKTIETITAIKPQQNIIDICFKDKYSICIINSDKYLDTNQKDAIALNFYNDSYANDQNACSSPFLIIWTGKKTEKAKKKFWTTLEPIVKKQYSISNNQILNKIELTQRIAIEYKGILSLSENNYITRLKIETIFEKIYTLKGNSGLFIEYETNNLLDLTPILNDNCQTIIQYGLDSKIIKTLKESNLYKKSFRIVKIGQAQNFNLFWDGYDLINLLTK